MKDDLLGKTFQLLGLGMYEKWDAALELLNSLSQSEGPVLISGGVSNYTFNCNCIYRHSQFVNVSYLLDIFGHL